MADLRRGGPPSTRKGYAAALSGEAAKGCAGRRPLQVLPVEIHRGASFWAARFYFPPWQAVEGTAVPHGTGHARSAGGEACPCVYPSNFLSSSMNGMHSRKDQKVCFSFGPCTARFLFFCAQKKRKWGVHCPAIIMTEIPPPVRARKNHPESRRGRTNFHPFSKYAKSANAPPDSCTISQLNKYAHRAYNVPIIKQHEGGPHYEE